MAALTEKKRNRAHFSRKTQAWLHHEVCSEKDWPGLRGQGCASPAGEPQTPPKALRLVSLFHPSPANLMALNKLACRTLLDAMCRVHQAGDLPPSCPICSWLRLISLQGGNPQSHWWCSNVTPFWEPVLSASPSSPSSQSFVKLPTGRAWKGSKGGSEGQ